jgi:hypothetical protein
MGYCTATALYCNAPLVLQLYIENWLRRAQRRIAALERNWLIKAVAILAALAGAMISFLQLLRLLRQ